MQQQEVESSVIDTVAYSHVVEIRFDNGRVYQFYEVPEAIYAGFLKARSKGRYFNYHIRGKFPFQEVELKSQKNGTVTTPRADSQLKQG